MAAQRQRPAKSSLGPAALAAADAALEGLRPPIDELRLGERLRMHLPADVAALAVDLARARGRAAQRHPLGECGFFTSRGLEQSTSPLVADARALRLARQAPGGAVLDATCGIGADSTALARSGLDLVSMDHDPLLAACARANLARAGLPPRVVIGDARHSPVRADWLVLDPDRRAGGTRSLDPDRWSPTLAEALALASAHRGACVKLPPAFDPARLQRRIAHGLLQWVSLDGELRELDLWTGELAGPEPGRPREVLALSSRGEPCTLRGEPLEIPPLDERAARGVRFLADPDPALVRSGLLGLWADREGLAPLAARLAYVGGDRPPRPGLARAFRVLDVCACDARAVRRMLATHDVGAVEVRKRGHPDPAEVLARRFRGRGRRRGRVAVARLEGGHVVYLIEPWRERSARGVGDEGIEPPASSL